MNTEYILQVIRPYVVESQMTYADFERVFGFLPLREQYPIVEAFNKELKIFLVDEIVTDATTSDETILKQKSEILASNENLCRLIQSGDKQARQDLCTKNSRLVLKSAAYYHEKFSCSLELDDLIQEGNLGMLKAAEKFDARKGYAFSTYATWWIVQAITRAIIVTGQTIRLPVYMVEKIRRATRLDRDFQMQGFGVRERLELIAEAMNTNVEDVTELFRLRNAYMNLKSLDIPVDEEGETPLKDLIADKEDSLDDTVAFLELKKQIRDVLETLSAREKAVLTLRFGLYDGKERTLEAVGKYFHVTRERIRQIEAKALRKLRHPARSKKLHDFLD